MNESPQRDTPPGSDQPTTAGTPPVKDDMRAPAEPEYAHDPKPEYPAAPKGQPRATLTLRNSRAHREDQFRIDRE
jgi:hypothetical protein